jgi:hypothetical protein
MNDDPKNPLEDKNSDTADFGYITAIAGLAMAAILIIVMFATSGQV